MIFLFLFIFHFKETYFSIFNVIKLNYFSYFFKIFIINKKGINVIKYFSYNLLIISNLILLNDSKENLLYKSFNIFCYLLYSENNSKRIITLFDVVLPPIFSFFPIFEGDSPLQNFKKK